LEIFVNFWKILENFGDFCQFLENFGKCRGFFGHFLKILQKFLTNVGKFKILGQNVPGENFGQNRG
jgi:hypothetical protein